jgi:hypothetical protein
MEPNLSSDSTLRRAGRLTVASSVTFLVLLGLLHFLEPEFDPSWRMISEYALGQYGWMMRLAFFCWGVSVLALRVVLRPSLQTRGGRLGQGWLLSLGVALFGAGIFLTNPIMENLDHSPSTENTLHSLCGAIVILTFPIAATLVAVSLSKMPGWRLSRRSLFWWTLLLWVGLFSFFGSISVSKALHPDAGRVGPEILMGWPNRFMVVVYHLWLIFIAKQSTRLMPET